MPGEVSGLTLDGDVLIWNSTAPGAGSATVYDIVRGGLHELPVGSGSSDICLAQGGAALSTTDPALPLIGEGYWYLARARNVCGAGPYGSGSDGTPRNTAICP